VGRRPIYAFGFVIMAFAYFLYPLATAPGDLYLYRAVFAVGAACVASMLAAIIADYAMETSRGRLVGICFFLNGIGVATLVVLGGRLPRMIEAVLPGHLSLPKRRFGRATLGRKRASSKS
jgi:MFS family permease